MDLKYDDSNDYIGHTKAIFSQRLSAAMDAKGYTGYSISKKLNGKISAEMISRYKNGEALPAVDKLLLLSDALGVSCDYLVGKIQNAEGEYDTAKAIDLLGLSNLTTKSLATIAALSEMRGFWRRNNRHFVEANRRWDIHSIEKEYAKEYSMLHGEEPDHPIRDYELYPLTAATFLSQLLSTDELTPLIEDILSLLLEYVELKDGLSYLKKLRVKEKDLFMITESELAKYVLNEYENKRGPDRPNYNQIRHDAQMREIKEKIDNTTAKIGYSISELLDLYFEKKVEDTDRYSRSAEQVIEDVQQWYYSAKDNEKEFQKAQEEQALKYFESISQTNEEVIDLPEGVDLYPEGYEEYFAIEDAAFAKEERLAEINRLSKIPAIDG